MDTIYDIPPITKTTTNVITKFNVRIIDIEIFKSCLIGVTFYTEDKKFVEYKTFALIGDDYEKWTTDDYIIEYIRNNI